MCSETRRHSTRRHSLTVLPLHGLPSISELTTAGLETLAHAVLQSATTKDISGNRLRCSASAALQTYLTALAAASLPALDTRPHHFGLRENRLGP